MASHKRSFQYFDAIVDNYPHKPSFPVGHRFGVAQKSSQGSTHLEPLEDHGCYLCTDHQQAKPMTTEASGSQSTSWHQPQTQQYQHVHRRPTRPDGEPVEGGTRHHHHHHHKHSKKILLVKNSDPSIQKTIVLHRRTVRSIGVFLDDVSELMQCLIRKLYTLEGHKIDSVQSLLQCPSILVCVGREPFHPMFLDSFRKNSDDKLPKLLLKSRSNAYNDERGCKNVNFGLDTKKSVIHPREHSTDKSARLTMSSEKSIPHGHNSVPPIHTGPYFQARENMMDDDIEKRVLVNKDGSLSMEMKVRFRLSNDETLHWSTEIKKSSGTLNESFMGHNDAYSLQHSNSESCSEVESLSAGDADTAKLHQKHLEEPHCQHCCTYCQEYDFGSVRHIRSSSSSASSHKIVCKKTSVDSMHTMSSEEYTEQVVEKATCFQQTVGEDGDTKVEYCTISRCCNRSEVCSVSAVKACNVENAEKGENSQIFDNDENETFQKDFVSVQITHISQEEERLVPVESNSSHVIASLKNDQDEEETEHSLINSGETQNSSNQEDDEINRDATPVPQSTTSCKLPVFQKQQLSPKRPSKASDCSVKSSSRHCKYSKSEKVDKAVENEAKFQQEKNIIHESDIQDIVADKNYVADIVAQPVETDQKERSSSAMSSKSNASGKSGKSKVKVVTEQERTDVKENLEKRTESAMSSKSNISTRSREPKLSEVAARETKEAEQHLEERVQSAMSNASTRSRQSNISQMAADEYVEVDNQIEERVPSAMSTASERSNLSKDYSELKEGNNVLQDRSPSTMSAQSNASARSKKSNISGRTSLEPKESPESLERATSAKSTKSNASTKSKKSKTPQETAAENVEASDVELDDRVSSAMSAKSNTSVRSNHSRISEKSTADNLENVISFTPVGPKTPIILSELDSEINEAGEEVFDERAPSARSVKSNSSVRSNKSSVSFPVETDEMKEESEKRASSAMSAKSATSSRSEKHKKAVSKCEDSEEKTETLQERVPSVMSSTSHASDRPKSAADESAGFENKTEERASSAMSIKSNTSTKTNRSKISEYVNDITENEERSKSVMSSISDASTKSKMSKKEELVGLQSQTNDRAPSALSVESNISERSAKSNVSQTIKKKCKNAGERSASAMTSKSNVSEKSNVSHAHDEPEDAEDHTEQRAISAMSMNSNISGKSNISIVATDENLCVQQKDSNTMSKKSTNSSNKTPRSNKENVDRVVSPLSTKSNKSTKSDVSGKSNKSKVSEPAKEKPGQIDEDQGTRSPSALSNTSIKSKNSTVFDAQCDNVDAETFKTDERSLSAMSVKTNASARSISSKASETPKQETGHGDEEERALSAMSCKSIVSTISQKSKALDTVAFKPPEADNDKEESVASTPSAKSCISTRSKISEDSGEALKKAETTDEEGNDNRFVDSVSPCSLSARDNACPSSKTSDCSETGHEDPEDGENSTKASNAASPKSNLSTRSKKSECLKIVPDVSADVEDQTTVRTPSVLSTKSNTSTRSKKSRGSNMSIKVKDKEIVLRSSSAMSAASNSSATSKKSKLSEVQFEKGELEEEQGKERAPSITSIGSSTCAKNEKSSHSNSSAKAKSEDADAMKTEVGAPSPTSIDQTTEYKDFNERSDSALSIGSVKSKKSQNSERTVGNRLQKEHNDEKSASVPLIQSNISEASTISECKHHMGRSKSYTSVKSNSSAKSKETVSSSIQAKSSVHMEEELNRAKSQVSAMSNVSTKSKKSTAIKEKDNGSNSEGHASKNEAVGGKRVNSALSDHSMASGSVKCICEDLKKKTPTDNTDNEERSASALSEKSAKSKISSLGSSSERDLTPASASVSIGIVEEYDADNIEEESVSVTSTTSNRHLKSKKDSSDKETEKQQCIQTPHERPKSSLSAGTNVSNKSRKSECSHGNSKSQLKEQKSPTSEVRSSSKATNVSHSEERTPLVTNKPKSDVSSSSNLEEQNSYDDSKSENANKQSKCQSDSSIRPTEEDKEKKRRRPKSTDVYAISENRLSLSPSKSPQKYKKPVILLGDHNDTVLSQSVSATEPLNEDSNNLNTEGTVSDRTNVSERTCNGPQDVTDYGRNVSDKTSEKSSKCRNRKGSSSSQQKADDDVSELGPSNLPNASPTEVVNEWLNKIPLDSALYDVGDELHENCEALETLDHLQEPTQSEIGDESERDVDLTVVGPKIEKEDQLLTEEINSNEDKEDNVENMSDKDQGVTENNQSGPEPDVVSKSFHSSIQVMRVLLSPKLDRCNSLPEVSTVYGRKLSTSARGLLDCLVNLQLIDFDPSDVNGKAEKYNDLMNMLQSLWLCDPCDRKSVTQKSKSNDQQSIDDELKAKSSSGVEVSSGSTGSAKSSGNDSAHAQKSQSNMEGEGLETLTKLQEVDEKGEEEVLEVVEIKSDSATPDIASRVQWTPENKAEGVVEESIKDSNVLHSDDTITSNDSPREPFETSHSSNKSAGDDHQEDTSLGTPSSVQRAPLTKKVSQDPDPVWVLNLLNKLEKQFMAHYVNAMAEFKVRWNLDDNEQLDAMICELRDEVHRRIQSSINRELKKIKGRAGKPKPPKEAMSRASTMQTEQRRRRLKVMLKQSRDTAAKSNDDYTGTGTDFSDQRSDDEYCPCDTCMKKKMGSRPVIPVELCNSAPVMMEFDLRKILQLKREAPTNSTKCNVEETGSEKISSETEGEKNAKGVEKDRNLENQQVQEEKSKEPMGKPITDATKEKEVLDTESENQEGFRESTKYETEKKKHAAEVETSTESKTNEQEHAREVDTDETVEQCEVTETENVKAVKIDAVVEEEVAERVATGTDIKEATEGEVAEDEEKVNKVAESKGSVESETVGTTEENKRHEDGTAGQGEETDHESADEHLGEDDADRETEEKETADDETVDTPSVDEEEDAEPETAEEKESLKVEKREEDESPDAEKGETDGEDASNEETTGEETFEDGAAHEEKICETAKDGNSTGDESVEEFNPVEDEITEETLDGQRTQLQISTEKETANEVAEDLEADEAKTAEEAETADDLGTTEDEIPEKDGETTNDEKAEADETSMNEETAAVEDKCDETASEETSENEKIDGIMGNVDSAGETGEDETSKNGENVDEESTEDGETADGYVVDSAGNEKTSDKGTEENGGTADDGTEEDGEITDEGIANKKTGHGVVSENEESDEAKTAENGDMTEDGTAEDGQTADDGTAEDGETADDGTAEDGETADDGIEEDEETVEAAAAEDVETTDDGTAEDGQTADDGTAEDSKTGDDGTAEDGETAEDGTAEDGETAEDATEEDGDTAEAVAAEDLETTDDGTAEDGQTADDGTAEDSKTGDDGITEDEERAEDGTAEEGEAADDGKSEDGETGDDGTAEDGETTDDGKGEDGEPGDHGKAEDGETADGETADDGTAEDGEMAEDGKAEDGETADGETADGETAEDGETADDGTAEDGETADNETAGGETADGETGEDGETADDETVEHGETADSETGNDGEIADAGTVEDGETADGETGEEGEIADDGTAEDGETADDGTIEDTERAKTETENCRETAEEESLDNEETAGEVEGTDDKEMDESDTAEGEEEATEEAGVAGKDKTHDPAVNSSVENTDGFDEVTELRADDDEDAPLKNEGDVVVHSIEEDTSCEESREECTDKIQAEESSELMSDSQDKRYPETIENDEMKGFLNSHFVNIGESAEGGDEAEDETEPDVETDEEGKNTKIPTCKPQGWSVQNDDQTDETTMVSFDAVEKMCTGSEDGADADIEDSETEVHSNYDTAEDKDDSDSIDSKRFVTANSLAEKTNTDANAKLSDIAEDAAEDEVNVDGGEQDGVMRATDCEEESSEGSLTRQMSKSSVESQPGSLEEVLDEEMRSEKSSDHLTMKVNCMYPSITSEEDSKYAQEKSDTESVEFDRHVATPKKAAKKPAN